MTTNYYVDKEEWKRVFSEKLLRLIGDDRSINSVANDLDLEPKTLHNYINRKAVPTAINLVKLSRYFNVSVDELISLEYTEVKVSNRTVLELAALIKFLDVSVSRDLEESESITLKFKDRILAMLLHELYLAKRTGDFDSTAAMLAKNFGGIRAFKGSLVNYDTFLNLIRHEYIYEDLEQYLMDCVDPDGNDCLGIDLVTYQEIERRTEEWDNMTSAQREKWWDDH